ncbi:hypothetical protein MBM_09659 [Drepanopeziza brunnea f. sp. 'multigermtubi' MB_m1]|uniref:Uncharacterized protein n=1 Tax=Marssonina brunnea f. sp. multigermtubi (strain MB_m1) TaxID=1072389 RepID=K1W5L1_MARBU|nr:uncharacterized protein MBM_09659 [Drepanopeziza brunnea f. sp. 'multigermtubi' MB_m1]EKD12160.1 hypothetical protein MBM_09659 [Drepanopeziza brunnea f. sp. 'multigermtubi' MB_m1]
MVLTQLASAQDSGNWDYNTLLDQLALAYDNPNKIQKAKDKLLACKQAKPLTKKRVLWDPFSDRPVRENEGLSEFDSDEREEILAEWNASGGYDADPDDYRDL